MTKLQDKSYVIVTPAYNEEKYIRDTMNAVLKQTIHPLEWVIVDDDSSDQTAAIIQEYAQEHTFIKYYKRAKNHQHSYYASNVYAIMEGYSSIKKVDYGYLAILDADISPPEDYYEQLLSRFQKNSKLGIASGVYKDLVNEQLVSILNDRRSTPKAIMVFRHSCFEQLGGFVPMKYGGEDSIACFNARMKSWQTWSFPELIAIHRKPVGTGHSSSLLKIRFKQGILEWGMATHPLFLLVKSVRRSFREKPLLFSGFFRVLGFIYGYMLGEKRQISSDLVCFIRNEQLKRLYSLNAIPRKYRVKDQ